MISREWSIRCQKVIPSRSRGVLFCCGYSVDPHAIRLSHSGRLEKSFEMYVKEVMDLAWQVLPGEPCEFRQKEGKYVSRYISWMTDHFLCPRAMEMDFAFQGSS